MKIKITHDVYNISKRIKNIDKDYFLVYDTVRMCFEVHNSSEVGSTLCVTLPYPSLDERALNLVMETSSKNIENIIKKIDYDNALRESADKSRVLSEFNEVIEDKIKETT